MSGLDEPSLEVKLAHLLAEEFDREPAELTPPLNDVIDVEALAALFEDRDDGTPRTDGVVRFRYRDRYVTVDSQGYVTIEAATRGSSDAHPLLQETPPFAELELGPRRPLRQLLARLPSR